jgi:putative protease
MHEAKTKAKMEILAPAGDREAFIAAVENGADAIYLGGKLFNARQFAQNFELEEIAQLTRYAHLNNVKVLITLNILIADSEMETALDYAHKLMEAEVDGIIVQDIGLAYALRYVLPDSIEVHASTQMTVTNSYGVNFAQELGLSQVVLAREVSLENIAAIRQKSKLKLEGFGHGALCSAYSGQCLMSSMMGGRSGNRGQCVQPCRMKYKLLDQQGNKTASKGEHLLSTKDLCTLDILSEMDQAGLNVIKLEGRMKRPEYVAVITREYRRMLDAGLGDRSRLERSFNRGFTDGYYCRQPGPHLLNTLKSDNQGMLIGEVLGVDLARQALHVNLNHPLSVGDGFDVLLNGRSILAGEVRRLRQKDQLVQKVLAGKAALGIGKQDNNKAIQRLANGQGKIYKTSDIELLQEAQASFRKPGARRRIPVTLYLEAKIGKPLVLKGHDQKGNKAEVNSDKPCEKAIEHPTTPKMLEEQLNRFGNSLFSVEAVEIESDPQVMVPASLLNQLRRQWTAAMEEVILTPYQKHYPAGVDFAQRLYSLNNTGLNTAENSNLNKKPLPELSIRVGDLNGVEAALKSGIREIYFGGESFNGAKSIWSQKEIVKAADLCQKYGAKGYYVLPRIIHEDKINLTYQRCQWAREAGAYGFLAGNPGALMMCRQWALPNFAADWSCNVFNNFSIYYLESFGTSRICLSPELTLEQIKALNGQKPLEVLIHGRLPLMILEHCLPGNLSRGTQEKKACGQPCRSKGFVLSDRLNFHFPVETDMDCRNWIYNAKTLKMLEHISLLQQMQVQYYRIEAVHESPLWIQTVAQAYLAAIDRGFDQSKDVRGQSDHLQFQERLNQITPQGFTAGHYFRGV